MNLTQMKNTVLAMLAAVGSAVAQALGGWDVALKVLICFMALDYVTGWLVAAVWHKSAKSKTGALDSKASYKGLVKKGVMLSLVWMAALLDQATHSDFVRDAVCLFFVANEGLSVLENTAVMGVPYPAFVKNMLDALHQTGDQGKGQTEQFLLGVPFQQIDDEYDGGNTDYREKISLPPGLGSQETESGSLVVDKHQVEKRSQFDGLSII